MKRLAIFVSGGGTDMQSILDGISSGEINAQVAFVLASKPGIFAIERAEKFGAKVEIFEKTKFESLEKMYDEVIKLLDKNKVDYIILAGYLTILSSNIIKAYRNKIINIHPSLIPKYCGDGMYGMRVHTAVIAGKEKESGCTVHFVDEGVDTGKIIAQEKVPVFEDDTPETLQKRVLEKEHELLPKVVKMLCEGDN